MKVERVVGELGAAAVEEVQTVTRRAFADQTDIRPPSGALAETAETVAADFAGDGGLLLRDDDGRLVATCRVRRLGLVWIVRRCAVDPAYRRAGAGRRMADEVHAWAAEEGAVRTHVSVRDVLTGSRAFWERNGYRPLRAHGFWTEFVRPLRIVLPGPDATHELGRRLAADLRAGDLVLLSGPLGAGKTALTQGIGAGLGVRGAVTSPTFVLARVHPGPLPLVHVDAYRLRESGSSRLELDDLDLEASLPDSLTVVEWGEGLAEGLAEARLEVGLERPDDDTRIVRVTPYGGRWTAFRGSPVVR